MTAWRRFVGYRPGRLGQNTLLGTAGMGTRAVIQAAYLLIVSRWLGAEGYGLFAGSVALVIVGAPLANWGSGLLLTRYIAQDRGSSRAMWATALVQTGVIGGLLVIIVLAISALLQQGLLPTPMLLLALSELLLLPAAHAAISQCYALERGIASAVVMCLVPLGRALAMLSFIVIGIAGTPNHAVTAHFIGSLLGLIAVIAVVATVDGLPAWRSRLPLRVALRQGSAYAVSNVAGNSYQEVDKILMLQMLGATVVGPYTVAFRVASIFLMPVTALIGASLPRLMARAKSNDERVRTYHAMLLSGVGYGVLAGVGILIVAPWVPRVFGSDYALATHYLALLALWPALFALRHCLATHLTANHRQSVRSGIEFMGLGVVVLLNIFLLPLMGAGAAALALLATEILMAVVLALLIKQKGRRAENQRTQ